MSLVEGANQKAIQRNKHITGIQAPATRHASTLTVVSSHLTNHVANRHQTQALYALAMTIAARAAVRVRADIIGHARIKYRFKYQSCMINKWPFNSTRIVADSAIKHM